ncbi:hypothetical protein J6590_084894 [Homalodisca vitripennis]|nr:hypothetical protein J6590_084894 [Homalodisca vitripennis]
MDSKQLLAGKDIRGAQIYLAQEEIFRWDFSSGEREKARIALAQGERIRLDCSSGRGNRGALIALAQEERFRWNFSRTKEL